jgi:hypothetical protein
LPTAAAPVQNGAVVDDVEVLAPDKVLDEEVEFHNAGRLEETVSELVEPEFDNARGPVLEMPVGSGVDEVTFN